MKEGERAMGDARIAAVVTADPGRVVGGGAPIFCEASWEQVEKTAFRLEKILDATAHDLENGTMILVPH